MSETTEGQIIKSNCRGCHGGCGVLVHLKNGLITRIEGDPDFPTNRGAMCSKGLAFQQLVYHPDRIKYPLKRAGKKGEGKWYRIDWDEALDAVAKELKRVKESYGLSYILHIGGTGSVGQFHTRRAVSRLLNLFGGCTTTWGSLSREGGRFASQSTYNNQRTGNTQDDLLNSRLIIMWGFNPTCTVWGTNTPWYLAQAKERGARIIGIDPRFTDSAAILARQWIPIRPGTDAAMMIAMAYVMIEEKLHDRQFLNSYIVASKEEGILVVDQHNAHERVLYERYLQTDQMEKWPRKLALLPILFDLSPSQVLSFESNQELLEETGFRVEAMGGKSYALKEYPDIFKEEEAENVFLSLLEEMQEEKIEDKKKRLLATLACKTAVKAGQALSLEKMRFLVEELFKTTNSSLCPHGRPIVVKIDKKEIEKGLKRS